MHCFFYRCMSNHHIHWFRFIHKKFLLLVTYMLRVVRGEADGGKSLWHQWWFTIGASKVFTQGDEILARFLLAFPSLWSFVYQYDGGIHFKFSEVFLRDRVEVSAEKGKNLWLLWKINEFHIKFLYSNSLPTIEKSWVEAFYDFLWHSISLHLYSRIIIIWYYPPADLQ